MKTFYSSQYLLYHGIQDCQELHRVNFISEGLLWILSLNYVPLVSVNMCAGVCMCLYVCTPCALVFHGAYLYKKECVYYLYVYITLPWQIFILEREYVHLNLTVHLQEPISLHSLFPFSLFLFLFSLHAAIFFPH